MHAADTFVLGRGIEAGNLRRAELTALERDDHVAEWIRWRIPVRNRRMCTYAEDTHEPSATAQDLFVDRFGHTFRA
jgi:hypothetical protein